MSTATRLPEKCRVYLDNTLLPERADGTGLPVPLSPFTIEWGVSAPTTWGQTLHVKLLAVQLG